MIEIDLHAYLLEKLPEIDWSWGKLNADTVFNQIPIGNFIKLPSLTSNVTPTYFDNIQITIRHEYIDIVQQNVNKIIELFQSFVGNIGSYQVWTSITLNGIIYESEDIVAGITTLGIKYTIL